MAIVLSENFRALFYAPFYAAHATGAFVDAGVEVILKSSPEPAAAELHLPDDALTALNAIGAKAVSG